MVDRMIDKFVDQLSIKLQKYNCNVQLEKSAKNFLVAQGFDKRFGGRAIKRALRKQIEVPLAEVLINHYEDRHVTYVGNKNEKFRRCYIHIEL
ncbi:hypothetical protein RCO48_09130 [Peribacillus frigoritolerans]|nr:hypothetical protein [Peribacillus frigoritolerans]